jgi:hypothetical protein
MSRSHLRPNALNLLLRESTAAMRKVNRFAEV